MRSQDTITLSPFTEVDTPAGEVTIPRELGPVRLLREIGRGGMGVVYLARHQMLDRDVAVKFLLNAVTGPDDAGLARLLEGARAAARLEHPGLTTIHHADVVQGVPYLVMQYIDGPALNDVLKRTGPLSVPASFAVLDAILQAIGALHDQDIVHGDIKPANVLLDREGQVFVTDFGLSCFRPLGRRGEPSAGLAGTPAYMAPEMFDGTVSLRSDVHALGITAFELLTGELPFTGTLEELRHEPLPLDPLRRRRVDPVIIEVLERAAHKNAMFRYKTAEHFRNALRAGIVTDELLLEGVADLRNLGTRSVDKDPDVATTEAAGHTPTSTYFDRMSEIAEEKRAARELRDKDDAPKPTRDDRAQPLPLSPYDEQVEPGPIPDDQSTQAATLVADVPCVKCDYNLRGLSADGRCPECGEALASSLNPDRLMFADRIWLTRIARGLTLIYLAIPAMPFLMLLVGVTGALLATRVGSARSLGSWVVTSMLVILVAAVSTPVVGVFFSTPAEPRQSRGQLRRRTRWVVRTLAVLFVPTLMTAIALRITDRLVPILALGFAAAPFSGLVVSFLLHLTTLADRVPDRGLARKSRYLAILLVLLVILNLAMPSGLKAYANFQDMNTWFRWMITAIGGTSGIALVVTIVWIWAIIGAHRRCIKRAVAASVSHKTLFGDVPTEVALPS